MRKRPAVLPLLPLLPRLFEKLRESMSIHPHGQVLTGSRSTIARARGEGGWVGGKGEATSLNVVLVLCLIQVQKKKKKGHHISSRYRLVGCDGWKFHCKLIVQALHETQTIFQCCRMSGQHCSVFDTDDKRSVCPPSQHFCST